MPIRKLRTRRKPVYFQPEIETMPREELRKLQLERMRESLRNAYENVPLYRERFDAAA